MDRCLQFSIPAAVNSETVTVAIPVFCWGPTPPSTALTIRIYSDFSSRSSRAVVVISPKQNQRKIKV